jgi:guanylate kinase
MDEHSFESPVMGNVIIVSGPSGAGKSTVVKELLERCPLPLKISVSATTRSPRVGEVDGQDYFFLSKAEFDRKRLAGDFLEYKEVYGRGDWYGTLEAVVSAGRNRGDWLILEIDVEGALAIMQVVPDAISFFVHPGSVDELERRLVARGTDTREAIDRRLEVANSELAQRHHYRHEIINNSLNQSVDTICSILKTYQEETQICSKN